MVEIGSMPILWHIMKIYESHGVNDFIVCCGYKGHIIKDFFASYQQRTSSIRFNFSDGTHELLDGTTENWTVSLIDTGETTMTGGRLKRVRPYLNDEPFFFTYGDGVSNVDITSLLEFHKKEKAMVSLTAVQPPGRFGALALGTDQTVIKDFQEKPDGDGAWVNGGFFVVNPEALDYIADDSVSWEKEPLLRIANEGQLAAFRHTGFWQPMDTLRDKNFLESLWEKNEAPWKTW